jgi:hypothetical protein
MDVVGDGCFARADALVDQGHDLAVFVVTLLGFRGHDSLFLLVEKLLCQGHGTLLVRLLTFHHLTVSLAGS